MAGKRSLLVIAAVATSFTALVVLVLGLMLASIITFQLAILMCVALVGLYLGFGVLALVARIVSRME